MTSEEFYAQALLAALPIAVDAPESSQLSRKEHTAGIAHEYAAARS
jgi:hypothetical protein